MQRNFMVSVETEPIEKCDGTNTHYTWRAKWGRYGHYVEQEDCWEFEDEAMDAAFDSLSSWMRQKDEV